MVEQAPNEELSRELEQQAAKDRVMALVGERLLEGDSMDFRLPIFGDSDYESEIVDLIITPSGISEITKWTYNNGGSRQPEVTNPVPREFYQMYEAELTQKLSPKDESVE